MYDALVSARPLLGSLMQPTSAKPVPVGAAEDEVAEEVAELVTVGLEVVVGTFAW